MSVFDMVGWISHRRKAGLRKTAIYECIDAITANMPENVAGPYREAERVGMVLARNAVLRLLRDPPPA